MKFRGGGATRKTAPDSDLTISHYEDKDNLSPKPFKKTCLESFYENRYVILSLTQNLSILIKNIWHFYRQKSRKAAFTMAEVLITVGIIGIVAAMTLPSLIGNYQKKVTATRLKRTYTVIAQTIERSKVDYGDVSGWRLDEIAGTGQAARDEISEYFTSQFWEPWVPKIQGAFYGSAKEFGYEITKGLIPDNTKIKWYVLNDGTVVGIWIMVYIDENGNGTQLSSVGYWVDTNGLKKPNLFGQDIFVFQLNPVTGNIIDNSENLTRDELIEKCKAIRNGKYNTNYYYCVVLIAEDGWEFKYDYPW